MVLQSSRCTAKRGLHSFVSSGSFSSQEPYAFLVHALAGYLDEPGTPRAAPSCKGGNWITQAVLGGGCLEETGRSVAIWDWIEGGIRQFLKVVKDDELMVVSRPSLNQTVTRLGMMVGFPRHVTYC